MKRIALITIIVLLIGGLAFTTRYALDYMHWSVKSTGYPGLYEQQNAYKFLPADSTLLSYNWKVLATDVSEDGDIPNWPDAKELSVLIANDTLWLAASLHNNLDINDPMMTVAIENREGNEWYGTVDDFMYLEMITAGYYRKGDVYYGYNFLAEMEGAVKFRYDLTRNSLLLGVPLEQIQRFKDRRFVVSVGQKSYWNDDFDTILTFDQLVDK